METLKGNEFVSRVHYFEELASTNEFAKSLTNEENCIVYTDHQFLGKGQFGRTWESSRGENLTFTIRKRIEILPELNQYVNFFFTFFLCESIKEYVSSSPRKELSELIHIKWPNDILFINKKLSGILIESLPVSRRYYIGIGLNVNQEVFPDSLNATSLRNMTGEKADLNSLLSDIIFRFSSNFELLRNGRYEAIFEKWKKCTDMIGKGCEFQDTTGKTKRGIINNLNQDGSININSGGIGRNYFSAEIKLSSY